MVRNAARGVFPNTAWPYAASGSVRVLLLGRPAAWYSALIVRCGRGTLDIRMECVQFVCPFVRELSDAPPVSHGGNLRKGTRNTGCGDLGQAPESMGST